MELTVENLPKHIAIIMDGNRRWAKANGLAIKEGHKKGAQNLENLGKFCNKIGIKYLTVYAFSTENWKRSEEEVGALMFLLQKYVEDFLTGEGLENIKVNILGDITKLNDSLQKSINKIMEKSKNNTGLVLNIAFNYGGRAEIVKATQKIATDVKNGVVNVEEIDENMFSNALYTAGQPDPDLLIRPGGEQRISNYLLWQLAYTEFYFIQKFWPDFSEEDLDEAISKFVKRNRKFGGK